MAVGRIMARPVELLDTASATAAALRHVLTERSALSQRAAGAIHYCVTDDPGRFAEVGRRFMGGELIDVDDEHAVRAR